ncbi:MAG TPA: hypothetical protein VHW00_18170 [Thermoanaerobaculia bacterium]|nr:hypothetical protein [Thermoanaerobaculia bacterium]
MQTTDSVAAVSMLRRRLASVLFARQWLVYAAFAFLLGGVALLLAKRWGVTPPLWPGLLILALTVAAAAWRASQRMPSHAATIALLDAQAQCGGLLMAQYAVDMGDWRPSVTRIPRVAWRAKRQATLTAMCAAFLLVSAIVPARATTSRHALAIDADVEKLESRIELLTEENVLPAERADAMEAALEELKSDAAGDDPAKAWETLDSIDEATMRAAEEAAAESVQKAAELAQTEGTAMALTDGGLDRETLENAMNDPETQKVLNGTPLDEEQLRKLGASARAKKGKLRDSLSKLSRNGLLDPKRLGEFDKAGELGKAEKLREFLKECKGGNCKVGDKVAKWRRSRPGLGRGRGDAPMFFGEESAQNGKFKEETLPAASAAQLADNELLAVSALEPEHGHALPSSGGALDPAQAGGGSALTPAVQPRHRGTVQRFFERKPKQ